jgi:hypothetical protein
VADGDVFFRGVARGWGGVANSLRSVAPADILGPRIVKALAREVREGGGLTSGPMAHRLRVLEADDSPSASQVEEALRHTVMCRVTDVVGPRLVGDVFDSFDRVQEHVNACLSHARLPELAERLMRSPDGRGVTAPPRARSNTSDLLGAAAPLGRAAR